MSPISPTPLPFSPPISPTPILDFSNYDLNQVFPVLYLYTFLLKSMFIFLNFISIFMMDLDFYCFHNICNVGLVTFGRIFVSINCIMCGTGLVKICGLSGCCSRLKGFVIVSTVIVFLTKCYCYCYGCCCYGCGAILRYFVELIN